MKVAIVTSNRAEYGLLTPLIKRVYEDEELELQLLVTGAHLSENYGMTINQIKDDGFPITAELHILEEGNNPYDISVTIANAICKFAGLFRDDRPDILVILGDRTEMLGVATAALNENIPIAHIHGGEVTEGAVDDCIRHAITKISYLHFTGTEVYRKRVIQMGESPDRVFNVGTLGAENILNAPLVSKSDIRIDIGIPSYMPYVVVTIHPETIGGPSPKHMADLLCDFMRQNTDTFFVITASNSDVGGEIINSVFQEFAKTSDNAVFYYSLGMRRYLSAIKYAMFVLGNSSSGILEAPILGTPTINLGNRQKGRIIPETVVESDFGIEELYEAQKRVKKIARTTCGLYGDGHTSEKIVETIKTLCLNKCSKEFYDIDFT